MLDHWLDGIYPPLREAAAARGAQVRLHDHVRARNSSMVFAFNLFLPFQKHPLVLGPPLEGVEWEQVDLEWTPPGDLLCEIDGPVPRENEHSTAIDAVLWGRGPGGRRVAVLVEVKLGEGGFSPCRGVKSPHNRDRGPCDDGAVFLAHPERCYLSWPRHQARPRRYWDLFRQAHGSVAAAFPGVSSGPCPFRADGQQWMRQHALALALEQADQVDQAWCLLVHHDRNPDVPPPFDAYRAWVAHPHRFLRLTASTVLASGPADWARWMQHRYLLEPT